MKPMKSVFFLATFLASLPAAALTQYPQELPNGQTFRCLTCHIRTGGAEGWNAFGQEILKMGGANPDANPGNRNLGYDLALGSPEDYWPDLRDLDSDDDGHTNAEELGDLDCDSIADDGLVASNPGDAASTPENRGGEGEGEGEGEVGCAAFPVDSSGTLLAALALVGLIRRRRT